MSWLSDIFRKVPAEPTAAELRAKAWKESLATGQPPAFVVERLKGAATGRVPWTSTMTPAELLLAQTHGFRPLGVVTGTCWFRYARSWTEGHAEGWSTALARLKAEAAAAGANAVVDVKMRTAHAPVDISMDFTLIGTAIRVDGLPHSRS
jgi:hypothetical protein